MKQNKDKAEKELVSDTITEEVPVITQEDVQETGEEVPVIGVVVDCLSLAVRAAADRGANILVVINAGNEVTIDMANSTNEFYSVITKLGVYGFCYKAFIKIK